MAVQAQRSALLVSCLSLLASCSAVEIASPLQFNASVWGPAAQRVVHVVEHLDLTVLKDDIPSFEMRNGLTVKYFFQVDPAVEVIRGHCMAPYDIPDDKPGLIRGQCHMLVSWATIFILYDVQSIWIDRLYIREQRKPSDSAALISNVDRQPSQFFVVLSDSQLWLTRSSLVGTTDAAAISIVSDNLGTMPGKACISNCTISSFTPAKGYAGPVSCSGHLTLEDTVFIKNTVSSTELTTGIVEAMEPDEHGLGIIDMQRVTFAENSAEHSIMRFGKNSRVVSDDSTQTLTLYEKKGTATIEFDSLSPDEQGLLITTKSDDFLLMLEDHGWDELPSLPAPFPKPATLVSVVVVALVLLGAGIFIWHKKYRFSTSEQEDRLQQLEAQEAPRTSTDVPREWANSALQLATGMVSHLVGKYNGQPPSAKSSGAEIPAVSCSQPAPQPGIHGHRVCTPDCHVSSWAANDRGTVRKNSSRSSPGACEDSAMSMFHQPGPVKYPALAMGSPSPIAMPSAVTNLPVHHPATQTEFPTLPLPTANPTFIQDADGAEGLTRALDALQSSEQLFMGKYRIAKDMGRRVGGQGVVQFVQSIDSVSQFVVKFFMCKSAFQAERDLYSRSELREMMPATKEIVENLDGQVRTANGYVFPPCIVIEKGESLEEFALTLDRDEDGYVTPLSRLTMLQAIIFVADRLRQLHAAGVVHRDIKPSNILRLPNAHAWTLIDFGCAAQAGDSVPITYSLFYAPPEVVAALESGNKSIVVEKHMDAWALGVVAFEALTGKPALPRTSTVSDVCNRITGRSPMPWEGEGGKQLCQKLGRLGRTILACLRRDPLERPSAEAVVASWNHMFCTMATNAPGT